MPLHEHLAELRRRAAVAAIAVLIGGIAGFALSDPIIQIAAAPLEQLRSAASGLNFTTVGGAFDLRFKIAVTVGIVLASPVWMYQLWAFLVPGLTRRERRLTVVYACVAAPLFLSGASFGWWILPHIVVLLTSFAPGDAATLLNATEYYDFLLKLVVAVGVAFVAPLVLIALNAIGIVSARSIIRSWRAALVVITVFSAMVTPASDVLSMGIIALPLTALYAATAGWTHLHDRRASRHHAISPESTRVAPAG